MLLRRRCIRIYDERAGTSKVATLGERSRSAPWERVRCLRWARDGGRLVSGGGGNALRLWDVRQRATVHEWRAHEDTVWAVHGDENLRTVYSGGRDGRVRTCPLLPAPALAAPLHAVFLVCPCSIWLL